MSKNCMSVLYKHIIQVENKKVGLKVGGTNLPLPPPPPPPPYQKNGEAHSPLITPLSLLINRGWV